MTLLQRMLAALLVAFLALGPVADAAWAQDTATEETVADDAAPADEAPAEEAAMAEEDEAPTPGIDASTDTIFIFNSLLFLIGGFLVFWMAAGFAMLEAGLVRSKNVTMQLTKNISLFSLAAIFYYLIGYNLMYPLATNEFESMAAMQAALDEVTWMFYWVTEAEDGTVAVSGLLSALWGPGVLEAVGLDRAGADDYGYATTGSDFFFQLMFCATTASIVSGTLAERIKLWPFLIFTIVLTALS